MTYQEIAQQLATSGIAAGEKVCIVRGDADRDATTLYLLPVRWFIAMRMLETLYIGTYEGPELRLVGTKHLPFADVTSEFLKDEIDEALAEQVGRLLDPDALKDFLTKLPSPGRPQNPGFLLRGARLEGGRH